MNFRQLVVALPGNQNKLVIDSVLVRKIWIQHLSWKGFNKFLSHTFIPHEMLKGEIRPILKSGKGCTTDSASFRSFMNSSKLLKLLEYLKLPFIERYLKINPRQFGSQPNINCQVAISTMQQIIICYSQSGCDVHCGMIDLSKTFIRVNFDSLLYVLNDTQVPLSITDLINYLLQNALATNFFNGDKWDPWPIDNRAHQGKILFPLLFTLYINDVIERISELDAGCFMGSIKFSIICCAEHIVMLVPL